MPENEKKDPVDPDIDPDIVVEIPVNLKLRLEKCPKCGYERRAKDNGYASPFECPQCGVVYARAMEEVRRLNKGQQQLDEAEVHERRSRTAAQDPSVLSEQIGGAMFVGQERSWTWVYVVVALGILALFGFIFY